jgi:hypothetical protein
MCGGCSHHSLDDILPPPAKNMIDDIGEESGDHGETWCSNSRCFPTTKTGIEMFEQKLHNRIIRQLQYLEVIRSCALGLFADYEQSLVANEDVAWQRKHKHIVNPLAAGFLANRMRVCSHPAVYYWL